MATSNFSRLQREDWDKLGASALARELFNALNTTPATDGSAASGGGGNVGTVVSGGGDSYQVRLDTGATVAASAPGILSTETIPAGAVGVVVHTSSGYQLVFPAWLE